MIEYLKSYRANTLFGYPLANNLPFSPKQGDMNTTISKN